MMYWIRRSLAWPGGELVFVCSVLFVVIAIVHYDRIQQNWSTVHWEDPLFFEHNRQTIHTLADCLTRPALWPGLYRPLTTNCYYYVGGRLFAHQIEIYHAINVGLYALNALLFYGFVRTLTARAYALLAVLLFASRAAHGEVIANTAEFQVLAATAFTLLALLCFAVLAPKRHGLLFVAYPCLLLALLSKEASVAGVLMVPLYAWLFVRPWRWSYLLGPLAISAGWLAFVTKHLGTTAAVRSTGFHFTNAPPSIIRNMTAHLWSFTNQVASHETEVIMPPAVQTMAESMAGQSLLLLLVGVTLTLLVLKPRVSRTVHLFTLGSGFFCLAILPYSFFADRLFMRYGYASHSGLALATAALLVLGVDGVKVLWTKVVVRRWFVPHPESSG